MGRLTYVCTTCSEHFTRKYSAKRHNITIHGNGGEIVTLVEYIVGRSSGRYKASHPFWYRRNGKRIHKFGRATVEDYVGDTFPYRSLQQQGQYQYHQQSLEEQERYHWQQHEQEQQQSPVPSIPPPAAIQDQPPGVLPYPTEYQSQSMNTTEDEQTTTLSHETIQKIEELERLIYRYSRYHHFPAAVINCITYYCNNGDNTLLDEKLEQLRTFDRTMRYPRV